METGGRKGRMINVEKKKERLRRQSGGTRMGWRFFFQLHHLAGNTKKELNLTYGYRKKRKKECKKTGKEGFFSFLSTYRMLSAIILAVRFFSSIGYYCHCCHCYYYDFSVFPINSSFCWKQKGKIDRYQHNFFAFLFWFKIKTNCKPE